MSDDAPRQGSFNRAVYDWLMLGHSKADIMRMSGKSAPYINVTVCELTRRYPGRFTGAALFVMRVPQPIIAGLVEDAKRRGISVDVLVRRILKVVAADRLVDAVLDDGAGQSPSSGKEGANP